MSDRPSGGRKRLTSLDYLVPYASVHTELELPTIRRVGPGRIEDLMA